MPASAAITPFDKIDGCPGARGGARIGLCNVTADVISAGLTSEDVGKTIMIAGAGLAGQDWCTVVRSATTLWQAAPTAVTNAQFHVGWDDTAALQRWMSKPGEHDLVDDCFLAQKPPLKYCGDALYHGLGGSILIGESWPSGFSICNETYLTDKAERSNVYFDGAATIELSPAHAYIDPSKMRKGIGITHTRHFSTSWSVDGLTGKNGFAIQIHYSSDGVTSGSVANGTTDPAGQGADGIHFTGSCSDVTVVGMDINSADDSTSWTHEIAAYANAKISKVQFLRCNLRNKGHSSVKGLVTSLAGASIIEDIEYRDCFFETELSPAGAGVPFIMCNNNRAGGAFIRDIAIKGGRTTFTNLTPNNYGMVAMDLTGVDRFRLEDHTLEYPGYTAIRANDCKEFRRWRGTIMPLRTGLPPNAAKAVTELTNCPGPSYDPNFVEQSFAGQVEYRAA